MGCMGWRWKGSFSGEMEVHRHTAPVRDTASGLEGNGKWLKWLKLSAPVPGATRDPRSGQPTHPLAHAHTPALEQVPTLSHTHEYPHTHSHTHIRLHANKRPHSPTLKHTRTLTHTRTYTYSHLHTHPHTHALNLAHIHTGTHTTPAHTRLPTRSAKALCLPHTPLWAPHARLKQSALQKTARRHLEQRMPPPGPCPTPHRKQCRGAPPARGGRAGEPNPSRGRDAHRPTPNLHGGMGRDSGGEGVGEGRGRGGWCKHKCALSASMIVHVSARVYVCGRVSALWGQRAHVGGSTASSYNLTR